MSYRSRQTIRLLAVTLGFLDLFTALYGDVDAPTWFTLAIVSFFLCWFGTYEFIKARSRHLNVRAVPA